MSVRAKFKVTEIKYTESSDKGELPVAGITMQPVYGNGDATHENTKFWKYTPSGKLEMHIINGLAAKEFEVGKSYYLDFTKAE